MWTEAFVCISNKFLGHFGVDFGLLNTRKCKAVQSLSLQLRDPKTTQGPTLTPRSSPDPKVKLPGKEIPL